MEIVYHKSKNIGDHINLIVFRGIEKIKAPSNHKCLGIGTILGLKKPEKEDVFHVFGSGVSLDQTDTYGKIDLNQLSQYKIHAVRGLLTTRALNIDESYAAGDFAYLLPDFVIPRTTREKKRIGFIPHKDSLDLFSNWDQFCADINLTFISPFLEPQEFIDQICQCEKVLCEAMHGAILSDAYGIPWRPIFTFPGISKSKWADWLSVFPSGEIPFTEIRGPRDGDLKKAQFSKIFPKAFATFLAVCYEKIFSLLAKRKINLERNKEFFLHPKSEIDKLKSRQRRIIESFKSEYSSHLNQS